MSDFNALKFVADNAGLNIFKALEKAYEQGKADAKAEAIPLAWIKGYIVTCDLFDLRVNVPASKVIKTMVKIWEQENPGAKRGGTDAVNN